MTRRTRILPLAAAMIALGVSACDRTPASEAKKPDRPVLVTEVKFEPRVPSRSYVGTIRARLESDLGFRVAGKVARRLVDVGDQVKAGQALATLDETDFKLQLDRAVAADAAAKSALTQARADFDRGTALRDRGWATEASLDKLRAAFDQAEGTALQAQRQVELARNQLVYATLTADADGIVTATMVEPGQVVASGQGAIRVAQLGQKEAVVAVPEILVGRVARAKATVTLWSQPDKVYPARLRELAPSADPATRTYLTRFSIEQAGDEVRFGMTGTVTLLDEAQESVARLPLSAVIDQGAGPTVFTVDAATGSLTARPVSLAGYEGDAVLVRSGLKDGDKVVTLGVQKLDVAQKVRVVERLPR